MRRKPTLNLYDPLFNEHYTSPLVTGNRDVAALYATERVVVRPTGYSVKTYGHDALWQERIRYRIYRIEGGVGRTDTDVQGTPEAP